MATDKGSKASQVLEALRGIGRGSSKDVSQRLDMERELVSAHLCHLRNKGLVEREGERGSYTWWPVDA